MQAGPKPRFNTAPCLQRRIKAEWRFVAALMLGLMALLTYFGPQTGVDRIDHALYDCALAFTSNAASNQIALIVIADAIRGHGRVVLPYIIDHGGKVTLPVAPLNAAAAGLGYINAAPDPDGVLRSFVPRRMVAGKAADNFAVTMAQTGASAAGAAFDDRSLIPEKPVLIPYSGPAGHFTAYPYAAVRHVAK